MKTKVKITFILGILLVGMIMLVFKSPTPTIDKAQIKTTFLINYPEEFNYRQTINDCGPFNTAAVVRTLKNEEVDSSKFAEEIEWRLPNKYTLPWGLKKQLEDNDIKIEAPNLRAFSDEEKVLYLQEQLSLGKLIIILGGRDDHQHYISVFGFDSVKNEFYLYDSMQEKNPNMEGLTTDENGELPGNNTFSSKELVDFWSNGGMYGLYKWYAIVASL